MLLTVIALGACAGGDPGEPRFGQQSCWTVPMTNAETGAAVVGAEDIEAWGGYLWVSAYDRGRNAEGGLYRIPYTDLGARASLEPVLQGIRPHGIDADAAGVNAILRDADGSAYLAAVKTFPSGDKEPTLTRRASLPCGANDLVSVRERITYTVDRGVCRGAFLERAMAKKAGRVEELTGVALAKRVAAEGLSLPNGVAAHADTIWIAEMRARRIVALGSGRTIPLPGAPDNLNSSGDGIVAALQPSLWRFGLYRYGYAERAPSRIVLVDPETEEIELLFDDPAGKQFPGATTATLLDGRTLIASSVRGDRLLVCKAP